MFLFFATVCVGWICNLPLHGMCDLPYCWMCPFLFHSYIWTRARARVCVCVCVEGGGGGGGCVCVCDDFLPFEPFCKSFELG